MENKIYYLITALRPKQWIKNLFVLIPLVFGKQLFAYSACARALGAFVLFCMMASAVYLINDIYDREQDRVHRLKKLRPIASGKLSILTACIAALLFAGISLVFSWKMMPLLTGILLLYFLLNILYSRLLKNVVIIDVFCLGAFFLLRIAAGTVVTGVPFSHWMIFMIFLLAMFLGFIKRRQELVAMKRVSSEHREVLSRYSDYFIDQMIIILAASIGVVYMLYTVDHRTVAMFGTRHLMLTIPFVYYGIFRYLYLIHQYQWGDDPTTVLYKDRMTQLNLVCWVVTSMFVIYFHG